MCALELGERHIYSIVTKYILDVPLLNNLFIPFNNPFISLIERKSIYHKHPLKKAGVNLNRSKNLLKVVV